MGDIDDHFAALEFDSTAKLLTSYDVVHPGTYYTSIADITKQELVNLSEYCDIKYGGPLVWSDAELEFETIKILHYLKVEVPLTNKSYPFLDVPKRKSNFPQLWIPGCGYPEGSVLKDKSKTFGALLGKELDMPVTILAQAGSSIQWSADQILRADIQPGDIVIWGLTSVARFPYYKDNNVVHVRDTNFHEMDEFSEDWLDSEHHFMQAITFIEQVKQQAIDKGYTLLLTQFLLNKGVNEKDMLTYLYQQPEFFSLYYDENYKDYGDYGHPGPLQHNEYYVTILKELKERGIA